MAHSQAQSTSTRARAKRNDAVVAAQRFKRLLPGLRAYARQATGKPNLQLEAGAKSMTDGKTIWICPPLALANVQTHNSQCGVREYGIQACPACANQEYISSVLQHEIGHIVHGSFNDFSRGRVASIMLDHSSVAKRSLPKKFYERIRLSLNPSTSTPKDSPLIWHVNQAMHPWLSMLMLMSEDIRCDTRRLANDKEERDNFFAINEDFMINGIESEDRVTFYTDMELNMQCGMAFMFKTTGHQIDGYFAEEVVDLLRDAEISRLSREALTASDTVDTFDCVLAQLSWFNSKGYMLVDDRASDDELQKLIEEIGKILEQIIGHGTEVGEGGGFGGRSSEDGEPVKDGLTPEKVVEVMSMIDTFDHVPVNISPPQIYEYNDGPNYKMTQISPRPLKSNERDIGHAVGAARLAFGVNARVEHHRNQRSGRIAGKTLAKRVPFSDDRLFARRIVPDSRSYHVVIGMDASSSSKGATLEMEKMAVLAMADVCSRIGVSFEIWAHCSDWYSQDMDAPVLTKVKSASDPWGSKTRENLRSLNASGVNLDGHTLQFYRKQAEKSRATDKIVMYYTDGAMPASNYQEELEVMQSEIRYCKRNNITLMAVGMGVDTPTKHGFDTAQVDSSSDYKKVVEHLGKRLMK